MYGHAFLCVNCMMPCNGCFCADPVMTCQLISLTTVVDVSMLSFLTYQLENLICYNTYHRATEMPLKQDLKVLSCGHRMLRMKQHIIVKQLKKSWLNHILTVPCEQQLQSETHTMPYVTEDEAK